MPPRRGGWNPSRETGRSEAGLGTNKQMRPKGWEEEAKVGRYLQRRKGKSEQFGPPRREEAKKVMP